MLSRHGRTADDENVRDSARERSAPPIMHELTPNRLFRPHAPHARVAARSSPIRTTLKATMRESSCASRRQLACCCCLRTERGKVLAAMPFHGKLERWDTSAMPTEGEGEGDARR